MNTRHSHLIQQINSLRFLTDGGMETDLIFNKGIDLPCFASFDLLSTDWGRQALREYYVDYLNLAEDLNTGFILETPTWRANRDWGAKLGYDPEQLAAINRDAVTFLHELRAERQPSSRGQVLVSGAIGPRGDGYIADTQMSAIDARDYHRHQVEALRAAGADMVSAFTLNYREEALGVVLAAREADVPVVISYTLETDGLLPSGESLAEAITAIDEETDSYPLYYMINCAHPSHFEGLLGTETLWKARIRGIRGNASKCSHAELDAATELDDGNPEEFGSDYRRLQQLLPELRVYGGCCGTDIRHVASIAEACLNQSATH